MKCYGLPRTLAMTRNEMLWIASQRSQWRENPKG